VTRLTAKEQYALAANGQFSKTVNRPVRKDNRLFTDDGVALGGGAQSSEERHAGRFLLALGETGTGGGDPGRRIHLVRAHRGSGIGVRCDHLDVAALLAQGLDVARQVRAPFRWSAQALELACRVRAPFRWCPAPSEPRFTSGR